MGAVPGCRRTHSTIAATWAPAERQIDERCAEAGTAVAHGDDDRPVARPHIAPISSLLIDKAECPEMPDLAGQVPVVQRLFAQLTLLGRHLEAQLVRLPRLGRELEGEQSDCRQNQQIGKAEAEPARSRRRRGLLPCCQPRSLEPKAFSTSRHASSIEATAIIDACPSTFRSKSHVCMPITGLSPFSARPISDKVPYPPPTATTTSPTATTNPFRSSPMPVGMAMST